VDPQRFLRTFHYLSTSLLTRKSRSRNRRGKLHLISSLLRRLSATVRIRESLKPGAEKGKALKLPVCSSRSFGLRLRVSHREMGHFAPRAMNQRALPSILLSFLIVCFFAVALFQPDPPRRVRAGPRSRPGATTSRSELAGTSGRDRAVSERLGDSPTSSRVASGPSRGALPDSRTGIALQPPAAANDGPILRDSRTRIELASDSRNARGGEVPARSARRASGPARTPALGRKVRRSVPAREPRSAFTVARPDETIEEIALRIYGTSDQAETLRKANRDTLPREDSPLSSGMVLRTPRAR
jgi:hypothetical protein